MAGECFVISPIGENGSATRRHADLLMKYILEPVLQDMNYSVTRADKLDLPGSITSQIISKLVDVDLVIADLSEHNPNVFYELAVRHAAHLPVIHMAKVGERLPFDIAGFRTIFFDLSDLDSVAGAKDALKNQISSINNTDFESPISVAFNIQKVGESSNPTDMLLSELLSEFSELKTTLQGMQQISKQPSSFDTVVSEKFTSDLKNSITLSRIIGQTIKLKKAGREWRGLSPFRSETTPSFYVNDQKQAWFDFASGQNGNIFDWLMKIEGLSFGDAVFRAIELRDQPNLHSSDVSDAG